MLFRSLHMQIAEDVEQVKFKAIIIISAHPFVRILMLCTTRRSDQGEHGGRIQQQEATWECIILLLVYIYTHTTSSIYNIIINIR